MTLKISEWNYEDAWLKEHVKDKNAWTHDYNAACIAKDLLKPVEEKSILAALRDTSDSIIGLHKELFWDKPDIEPEYDDEDIFESFDERLHKYRLKNIKFTVHGQKIRPYWNKGKLPDGVGVSNSLFITIFRQNIITSNPKVFSDVDKKRFVKFIEGGYKSIHPNNECVRM